MHKKILSMILAIAMVLSMFAGIAVTASAAETATLSFAGGSATNGEWTFTDEASGVSAVFAKNNHSTAPRWDANCVRFYGTASATNTLTVSAPAGGSITGITFTMNGTYTLEKVAADTGALDAATLTWTGSAEAVVFTATAQTRIEGITVSYEASGCDHANAEVVTTDATCTAPGSVVTTCSCGYTKTEEIPALGHVAGDEIIENVVEATEIAGGSYEIAVYCTVCGAELSREYFVTDPIVTEAPEETTEAPEETTEAPEETTEAPEETTEPEEEITDPEIPLDPNPKTGDSAIILVIAAIAVLALAALYIKRRQVIED